MGNHSILIMKKGLITILTLCLVWTTTLAQQSSQYTNFIKNYIAFNPAAVGSVKCIELNFGHREQWRGIDGAPVSSFANFQGKIGVNKFNFHGLGAVVETDDTGPLSHTSLSLAYSYHMRTSRKGMLAMGMSLGFTQYRIDYGAMTFVDYNDPAII